MGGQMIWSPKVNVQQFKNAASIICAFWEGHSGLSCHRAYGTGKRMFRRKFHGYSGYTFQLNKRYMSQTYMPQEFSVICMRCRKDLINRI